MHTESNRFYYDKNNIINDIVLVANTQDELQHLLNSVVAKCNEYGLQLNIKKTKYMVVSKNPVVGINLFASGINLKRTEQVTYLGCQLNAQ